VVFNDNDPSGYDHADTACRLSVGLAKRICRLDLAPHWPDMPEGADVSDWLATGHTRDQLDEPLERAPEWTPQPEPAPQDNTDTGEGGITLTDFHAFLPDHTYIFRPTRQMWPAASVNAKVAPVPVTDAKGNPKHLPASAWLDVNRCVEQMTWAPGEPEIIKDRYLCEGGFIERKGATTFNLYRAPTLVFERREQPTTLKCDDKEPAARWLDLVYHVYPDDAPHIIKFLAHRVQHPGTKINHGLLLFGDEGIGKDTILVPVKAAVGEWNVEDVKPRHIFGRFNGYVKSVLLIISEIHDMGEHDRFQFHDLVKTLLASPPVTLRADEKNVREYAVLNVTGVVMTTNHLTDGLFIPANSRRYYVAASERKEGELTDGYWVEMYDWYNKGGNSCVASYLAALDLSDFNPKAPPKKTDAFWQIVNANRSPEDGELADILDDLGNPDAVTLAQITDHPHTNADFGVWLRDRKNRRTVGYRFERCEYVAARNEDAKDGLWRINGKRQVIYARGDLSIPERFLAARRLAMRD
jgi:hypothetical protein